MNKNTDFEEIMVGPKVLETLFGVGERTIQRLAEQGIVKRNSKGKYFLMKSVKAYVLTLKAAAAGKNIQTDDDEDDLDLDKERALHERVKRQIDEIKLELIKGKVHKAEDVQAIVTDMLTRFKSKMEAMPSKLARKLEGKKRTDIQKTLAAEIRSALEELSEYNPVDYYSDEHIDVSNEELKALGVDDISDDGGSEGKT